MRNLYLVFLIVAVMVTGSALGQENAPDYDDATVENEERSELTGRDMNDIRDKIIEIKDVVQRDYEALLATDPEAAGTITISFTITPEGAVTETLVECPDELSELRANIVLVLEELEFGASIEQTEDIPVTVPFTLTPPE
ncbi:MAG: hypothetical protein K8S62_09285 [Candidatus Sabulitectum sp.]|nr:hypothetical protein [Candidatus Sabulitectum sp.]